MRFSGDVSSSGNYLRDFVGVPGRIVSWQIERIENGTHLVVQAWVKERQNDQFAVQT